MEAGFEPKEFDFTAGALHFGFLMPLLTAIFCVYLFSVKTSQKKLHHYTLIVI